MSVPQVEQNVVATHVYPVTDLGFVNPVANGATQYGTQFGTGMPATVVVLCQLLTGTGTLDIQYGASGFTPTWTGGSDTQIALSTSLSAAVVNTSFVYTDSDPTVTTINTDNRYIATRVINTHAGNIMQFSTFVILVCYELTQGEDWFQGLRGSCNAVANRTVGDGSGVMSLDPDVLNSPYLTPGILY